MALSRFPNSSVANGTFQTTIGGRVTVPIIDSRSAVIQPQGSIAYDTFTEALCVSTGVAWEKLVIGGGSGTFPTRIAGIFSVYLDGTNGVDTNTGLTVISPVLTFGKAVEILATKNYDELRIVLVGVGTTDIFISKPLGYTIEREIIDGVDLTTLNGRCATLRIVNSVPDGLVTLTPTGTGTYAPNGSTLFTWETLTFASLPGSDYRFMSTGIGENYAALDETLETGVQVSMVSSTTPTGDVELYNRVTTNTLTMGNIVIFLGSMNIVFERCDIFSVGEDTVFQSTVQFLGCHIESGTFGNEEKPCGIGIQGCRGRLTFVEPGVTGFVLNSLTEVMCDDGARMVCRDSKFSFARVENMGSVGTFTKCAFTGTMFCRRMGEAEILTSVFAVPANDMLCAFENAKIKIQAEFFATDAGADRIIRIESSQMDFLASAITSSRTGNRAIELCGGSLATSELDFTIACSSTQGCFFVEDGSSFIRRETIGVLTMSTLADSCALVQNQSKMIFDGPPVVSSAVTAFELRKNSHLVIDSFANGGAGTGLFELGTSAPIAAYAETLFSTAADSDEWCTVLSHV